MIPMAIHQEVERQVALILFEPDIADELPNGLTAYPEQACRLGAIAAVIARGCSTMTFLTPAWTS
jgi:hypothetical protein